VSKSCFEGSSNSDGLKAKNSFKFEKKFPLVGYPEVTYEELDKVRNLYGKSINRVNQDWEDSEAEAMSFFSDHPIDFRLN